MYAITDRCSLKQCLSERDQLRRHMDSLKAIDTALSANPDIDVSLSWIEDGLVELAFALKDREDALADFETPIPKGDEDIARFHSGSW
jgi:hypothetical protein